MDSDIALRSTGPTQARRTKQVHSVHLGTELPMLPLDTDDDELIFNDDKTVVIGGTPQKLLGLITNIALQGFTRFLGMYHH